jgi:hypothetical protein
MDRSSWAAISKDPDIWKKIGVGTASLCFILSAPLALGIINTDLEAEATRLHEKRPPEKDQSLPPVDDLLKLLMSGIGPALLLMLTMLMFAIATIPTGLAAFNLYAFFRPPNELAPELHQEISLPLTSVVLYLLIGAVGLALQALVAAVFPVALAQYARGKDLLPALAVVGNTITVLEMGLDYWLRVSGVAIGMVSMTIIFITGGFGFGFVLSTLIWLAVTGGMFVSLVLASRFALTHIAAELPPAPMAPLPDDLA